MVLQEVKNATVSCVVTAPVCLLVLTATVWRTVRGARTSSTAVCTSLLCASVIVCKIVF